MLLVKICCYFQPYWIFSWCSLNKFLGIVSWLGSFGYNRSLGWGMVNSGNWSCWFLQTNLILLSSKQLTLNNNILWSSSYNMGHLRRTIVEISSAQNCSPHTCIMCDHNNGPTMIRVGNHHKFKFNKANHNNVPTMIRGQQSPLKFTGYITKIHKNFNTF